jgi:hypothetical protein
MPSTNREFVDLTACLELGGGKVEVNLDLIKDQIEGKKTLYQRRQSGMGTPAFYPLDFFSTVARDRE